MNTLINIESYYFFRRIEVVVGRILDSKLVVCIFYLTVHCFLARVQSPTCTTYGKYLLESIMAMLTPKSGIWLINHAKELREFVLFIKLFVVTKMEISKNMRERITRHWIRPCIHKSIGGRLPIHFTVW